MTEADTAYAQDLEPASREYLQRRWYWYDWANSAYATTIAAVLIAPYLTAVAKEAACPGIADGETCRTNLDVLGIGIAPGSLAPFTITVSTLLSALVLIFVGGIADRSERPTRLLGAFAWTGAASACLVYFIAGTSWQLGVVLIIVSNLCFGASMVVYDALLVRIAPPDDRDRVSSRGWAFGYFGGGVLLALNLFVLSAHDALGMSEGTAVRISLLSAGLWWAGFTIIPVRGLRSLTGTVATPAARSAGVVRGSLVQLRSTFGELRRYPQTLQFLVAYLFFNDGIQTVISSASLYGKEELGFSANQLVITILLVQFVAFGGALLFGRLARTYGATRLILWGLGLWVLVVVAAFFLPAGRFGPWLALGVGIGIVLGGTQALSRSLYSQLIPRGRESEFFSLYQAMERGTSWFGTLLFGLVYQLAHSYRLSIIALIVFFVLGGTLLARCDVRAGIRAAGNTPSRVV
ncbi:MFS transporter [Luteipulveratus flavus]|uniref:MFS transporter n=1 Tax=Luteipulveratus flavus TaxID=3031728 RepID=A0ABT6CD56_9MICO|nr:MFS transporter [Luteipulveratus sp. YIM 133296]MDF8266217.1 MFS transporter [Luteipulveratus sp. YIM 133296]